MVGIVFMLWSKSLVDDWEGKMGIIRGRHVGVVPYFIFDFGDNETGAIWGIYGKNFDKVVVYMMIMKEEKGLTGIIKKK